MGAKVTHIGIVGPGRAIDRSLAERVTALAGANAELVFHPQCFLREGHFAGPDAARAAAFAEYANDASLDAVWFARGGYGACRILDLAFDNLGNAARRKTYLGYSDAGNLLARLARDGIGRVAHGPMASDAVRNDPAQLIHGIHLAFLTLGSLTVLSALVFRGLRPDDGTAVSHGASEAGAKPAALE